MSKAIATWKKEIGVEPMQAIVNEKNLEKAWEEMGRVYGKVQLEKQRYKRSGMTEAVKAIDEKIDSGIKKLEAKTIELLGYPKLDPDLKSKLTREATFSELFLNTYSIEEYKKIPPTNVANAITEAKQYFDDIEIWAIEEQEYVRPIKDPAVVGYVKGEYPRTPYLIATWGDDIKPEDLGVL